MANEYVNQIKKGTDTYDIHDERLNSLVSASVGQGLVVTSVDENNNVEIGASNILTSFNGRSGAVVPASGDYTAEMVGADSAGSASTVNASLTTHVNNETVHITSEERQTWNAKQSAITSGNKLSYSLIDGLSTIGHTGNLSDAVTDSTAQYVSATEKSTWNAKQNAMVAGVDYATVDQLNATYNKTITAEGVLVGTGTEVKAANNLQDIQYQTPQTTLAGYGITDAKIDDYGTITLGGKTITPFTSDSDNPASTLTGAIPSTVTATTQLAGTNNTTIATTAFVSTAIDNVLESSKAMTYEGTITAESGLLVAHNIGDTYIIGAEGTYAGVHCQVGDMVICKNDGVASQTVTNSDWDIVHTSSGAVNSSSSTSVDKHVPIFDGTTGDVIKDSGFVLEQSVTTESKLTDTVYTHPTQTPHDAGIYTITVDSTGHISLATTPTASEMRGVIPFSTTSGIGGVKYFHGEATVASWTTLTSEAEDYNEEYPYRGQMNIQDVTSNHLPEVIFDVDDATSGIYAPISSTFTGGIYIYASEIPTTNPTVTYRVTSINS